MSFVNPDTCRDGGCVVPARIGYNEASRLVTPSCRKNNVGVILPRLLRIIVLMMLFGCDVSPIKAQASPEDRVPERQSLDKHLFDRIYQIQRPAFRGVMRIADATAYPMFVAGPASAWLGVRLFRNNGDWEDAYRLTVSEMGAFGMTLALKYLARRTRPYVRYPAIDSRTVDIAKRDPYSFPSGHAALAFAQVVSWTLSHPRWYIAVPGYVWASSVALSRVWLGVHYPSDILAGAFIGTVLGWGVHRLGSSITPAFLRKDDAALAMPVIHFRLPLP